MTILDEIIAEKVKEVQVLKETFFSKHQEVSEKVESIFDSFQKSQTMNIIAEIKRASPSKGDIHPDVNPAAQAKRYEELGAGAISVLTDEAFFKGSMDDLREVRAAVSLPILCKDFIIDEIQIDRAKEFGANIILLIVAALTKPRLKQLYNYASSLGLDVLVEVHDEIELGAAIELNAKIIGINNRNLKTFKVDLTTTERLAKLVVDKNILLIGESGIKEEKDVERMEQAGVKGVLVGETLMRSPDLAATFKQLKTPFKSTIKR
ncbi:indole-3-glycerol phosphate synthase TrpC [Heyndrickxia sporothermodurans]|uniref:indole-3-glycerol phosphate synthase TrpC n=1 Tax=Heyndrickxia sporothermodurans TaxID=46224 RepID=UPI002E1A3946|nr:indole-3-glycerol phosphate synthase TrpC [Heyndrickxia sporothermodurans]MED3651373.1 indole-3-glycerol phosphate synthase TrpC [Heyndrickxia sporothermodurans]MED3653004.1 indole-3-glycerol phosphate synthase TrpC [Heyndrickxia sporothermodurans]MED3697464.1 indole-3-glycerol phosphate synthase TrpC [Heyndrickxia sporothermodurans]MED3782314.1 indole-3-glycerol phosphate synthase TrpC [Heyndrickxia sporothermodurans]